MKKISAIVLNYNTAAMTARALDEFLKASGNLNREIILIDNGSAEPMTYENPSVVMIKNPENVGFAKAVNQGIALATGEIVLLLNSDVFISEKTLKEMMSHLDSDSRTGIVGPMFLYPNGRFQTSAGRFPTPWSELLRFSMAGKVVTGGTLIYRNPFNRKFFKEPRLVDWVSGGCMLIKRSVIEKIGSLDERFFFGVEDFDYCYRAQQAGFKIMYLPTVTIIHHHGFSSGGRRSTSSLRREQQGMDYFLKKHFPRKVFLHRFVTCLYRGKIFVLDSIFGKPANV